MFRLNIDRGCSVPAGSDATNALCTLLWKDPGGLVYRHDVCQLYGVSLKLVVHGVILHEKVKRNNSAVK